MKKRLLITAIASLCSTTVQADFIGVHGRIGVWNATFEGETAALGDKRQREASGLEIPSFKERGFEEDGHNVGWVAFEHPIPFLPNIRIAYLEASSSGTSDELITLEAFSVSGSIGGVPATTTFLDQSRLETDMSFDTFDGTLYWELLDNWVSLDLGLTIRQLDGSFDEIAIDDTLLPLGAIGQLDACRANGWPIQDLSAGGISVQGCTRPGSAITQSTPIDIILPMLYTKAQFDLPFSGLYAAATFQGITADGNTMTDIDLELGYMLDLTVLEVGAYVGYRRAQLTSKDLDGLFADASLDGIQAGLSIHF